MNRPPVDKQRRRLVSAAGSLGAAGLAASVLGPAAMAQQVPPGATAKATKTSGGYRETEHTRTYYRLARY